MLIFEGIDKAGKSTLMEACKDVLRAEYLDYFPAHLTDRINMDPQHWGLLEDSFDFSQSYINAMAHGGFFCDRFIVSEIAYGRVYRDKVRIRPFTQDRLAHAMNVLKCLTVYVRPSKWETVEKRIDDCGGDEMIKRSDHYYALTREFDKEFLDTPGTFNCYNHNVIVVSSEYVEEAGALTIADKIIKEHMEIYKHDRQTTNGGYMSGIPCKLEKKEHVQTSSTGLHNNG